MSRLLFAAARGARVQRQQEAINSSRTWWEDVAIQWGLDDELRIHPDDEHLQYGPISSALRKSAIEGTLYAHAGIPYIMGEYDFGNENVMAMMVSQTHRGVFKLILAEALADEGL